MSIKIIKEGANQIYTIKCPVCGCEFEFEQLDARWNKYPMTVMGQGANYGLKLYEE